MLTLQGHAEFDRFVNGETLKVFGGPVWEEGFMRRAMEAVDREDDAIWAAGVMLKFFLEAEDEVGMKEGERAGEEDVLARL